VLFRSSGFIVALIVAVIEVLQFFIPDRVPDITDVLLAFIGAAFGAFLYDYYRILHQDDKTTLFSPF